MDRHIRRGRMGEEEAVGEEAGESGIAASSSAHLDWLLKQLRGR